MHLAAAAEELSGKACRIDLMKAHYDQLRERVVRALSSMRIEFTESQLKDAIYGPKNSIKHMDSRNDAEVSLDPESETAHFIVGPANFIQPQFAATTRAQAPCSGLSWHATWVTSAAPASRTA